MPLIDYRQVRAELRIADVLSLLGWSCRERSGEQVRGPCPVHGSSSPTSRVFSAHLGRGIWRCFRCQAGGNALDLYVRVSGLQLYPAVIELYQRLGQEVPWLKPVGASPANTDTREARYMRD